MAFTFFCPVKLIFGQPVAEALPAALAEIGARRVLLLSDPGLAQIGLAEQIAALLRGAGLHVATFFGVKTNPTVADVDAALAVARSAEVEALVAFGGGSVIDVGKAVGLLMTNGGSLCGLPMAGAADHPADPAPGGRAHHRRHRQRDDQGDGHRGRGNPLEARGAEPLSVCPCRHP